MILWNSAFRLRHIFNSTIHLRPSMSLEAQINGIFRKMNEIQRIFKELQSDFTQLQENHEYQELKSISNELKRKCKTEENTTKKAKLNCENSSSDVDGSYHYYNIEKGWQSTANDSPKNYIREDDYIVVYTDGACENNGKYNAKAGIGVWFNDNHPMNVSKPVDGRATNNTAEIQACVTALQILHNQGIRKVRIKTDSKFTIDCMTKWIHGWKKKNWTLASGGEVKNKEDLMKLDEIVKKMFVDWVHVRGHSGEKGNEEADKLARNGALKYQKS